MRMILVFLCGCPLFAQTTDARPSFAVASVKPSARILGKDAIQQIAFNAAGVNGKNLTLKFLIQEAYGVQPFQVSGGPKWLDDNEYDVDAKTDGPTSKDQLRRMLRTLLAERFGLALHKESKELSVYELVVDRNGPKIHAAGDDNDTVIAGGRRFRGDLQRFANLLSVQLSIVLQDDPGRPGMASGAPVPVVDKTGLPGIYDFTYELRLEPGADMFVLWQRVLQDQLGLKLEKRKSPVEMLVVDRASRIPTSN